MENKRVYINEKTYFKYVIISWALILMPLWLFFIMKIIAPLLSMGQIILYAVLGGILFTLMGVFVFALMTSSYNDCKKHKELYFVDECSKAGIKNLDNQTSLDKAKIVAQHFFKMESISDDEVRKLFEIGQNYLNNEIDDEKKREQFVKRVELRKEEEALYKELIKYAELSGRKKRETMLRDKSKICQKRADDLRKAADQMVRTGQEKELDWATLGGIASGIAGGAAGVATALDIQSKNLEIRARNDKRLKAMAGKYWDIYGIASDLDKEAQNAIHEFENVKYKLVSELQAEEVFKQLTFTDTKVEISDTGAFYVTTTVKQNENFSLWEDVKTIIDGTIEANVYQNNILIGTVTMVLPIMGTQKVEEIKGLSLSGAQKDIECSVVFEAGNLWAMEL